MPMGRCLLHGHHLNLNEQIWLSVYSQEPPSQGRRKKDLSKNRVSDMGI